jgi:serine protease AprX
MENGFSFLFPHFTREGTMKLIAFALIGLLFSTNTDAGEILRLKATGAIKPMASFQVQEETGLYLVQWKDLVQEEEKLRIERLGLNLLSYVPDDAFLVQGNRAQAERAAALPFVRVVVPYEAGMKMEPELTQHGVFGFSNGAKVSLQLAPGADSRGIAASLSNGLDLGDGLVVGEATVGRLWELARHPDVVWVERYLPMSRMDMVLGAEGNSPGAPTGFESGTRILRAESAYAAGFTGQGQLVAFADTGLDSGDISTLIPDFQGQVKSGFAVGLGGRSWGDPMNHGTHVAGSIAGSGMSSDGAIRGTAFGAKLVALGMWSDIMNNIMPPSVPRLFEAAYREGARIHSNSWGAPNSNGRYDNWASQADGWMFNNPDFLAVFAAGNDGADRNKDGVIDEGSVSSPGSAKNVLTVGASKNFLLEGGIQRRMADLRDGNNKWGVEPIASSSLSEDPRGMAAFSSRGPTADGRLKPDVVAPGTNIVAARSKHPRAKPEDSWGAYGDDYLYMGGTSMATPLTSGALAIVRQVLLERMGASTVSAALLKATIANTAEDLFPGQFGERSRGQEQPTRRPNNHQGWGLVNLEALVEGSDLHLIDDRDGLRTGQSRTVSVATDGASPLKVTMAYTDAPASANAARTLVNDLDLTVIGPDGTVHYPNGRSSKDSVNNMEQIDILRPVAGSYQVVVKAANVPQGKNGAQPFALVVSGAR